MSAHLHVTFVQLCSSQFIKKTKQNCIPSGLDGVCVLLLALKGEDISCTDVNKNFIKADHQSFWLSEKNIFSSTDTPTLFSTGSGFPLWKLVRIRAMVVRVLPWENTNRGLISAGNISSCITELGRITFTAWLSTISWQQDIQHMCSHICVTHQPHVICQYPPTNPLWYFFGRETCEGVVVQLASLLPEGWQGRLVFPCTHPRQSLFLVQQEGSTHRLHREIKTNAR